MRWTALILIALTSTAFAGGSTPKYYKWVDENGVTRYSDKVPPEAADLDKERVNDFGITVEVLDGKMSEEEKLAEALRIEKEEALAAQRQADQALLNTYLTIEEIMLHRDRRVELWQAQARVTELYLRNLERERDRLRQVASAYAPYNENPNAQMIEPDLMNQLNETEATIERHLLNLENYQEEENQIRARFDGDIARFKRLKGLE